MSIPPIAGNTRPSAEGGYVRSGAFWLVVVTLLAVCGWRASAQLPTYTVSVKSPLSVPTSQYGSVTATVTPTGGFTGNVLMSCQNLPAYASCKFPSLDPTVTVNSGAASITFTLNTSAVDQYNAKKMQQRSGMQGVALCMLVPAACLLLFRRRLPGNVAALRGALAAILVFGCMAGLSGCASVKPASTPPGTYNVIVNASYNVNTSASATLVLNVTS
jgi:hypothetical protein